MASPHPYLTRQLIAYIGNKRSLLPFLERAFQSIGASRTVRTFLDPFAGSGAVSRLARLLGWRVLANDWEPYARTLVACHVERGPAELAGMFAVRGGIEAALADLNGLTRPRGEPYVGRHYAPASTENADYRRERLFYTAENGLRIDAIRERIEEWYPGRDLSPAEHGEKTVLLASLLYQCATHTNTSGVFKAFHKGFGGHGRDALVRILAPIHLQSPVLVEGDPDCRVACEDAVGFAARTGGDLCYLDPPYNQHQYGSNYHLLNTIALWDRPPVSEELGADGRLQARAAIRRDWTRTRSAFCSRANAADALARLLDAVDCPVIALSYGAAGIIPAGRLADLLSRHGSVRLHASGYTAYRGGRQSNHRRIDSTELLWVVERGRETRAADHAANARALAGCELAALLRRRFDPREVRRRVRCVGDVVELLPGVRLEMVWLSRFVDPAWAENALGGGDAREVVDLLRPCLCRDRSHEVLVLTAILSRLIPESERAALGSELLRALRKLAHRKYRQQFLRHLARLRHRAGRRPARYGFLLSDLAALDALAARRLAG